MARLTDPSTWDDALIPLSVVATGARMPVNTLRSWFQRGHVALQKTDSERSANGLPHLFTLRSALALGATAELVRLGESPKTAFDAALHWTYIGAIAGEEGLAANRLPAGLFPQGWRTLLISSPYGVPYRVIPVSDKPSEGLMVPFSALFGANRFGARVVWLDYVDFHMRGACEGYLRPTGAQVWDDAAIAKLIGESDQ